MTKLCLEATVTKQNDIDEDVQRGLHSGNAYQHTVHNILSFRVMSKI
jgi:hypothetical protein